MIAYSTFLDFKARARASFNKVEEPDAGFLAWWQEEGKLFRAAAGSKGERVEIFKAMFDQAAVKYEESVYGNFAKKMRREFPSTHTGRADDMGTPPYIEGRLKRRRRRTSETSMAESPNQVTCSKIVEDQLQLRVSLAEEENASLRVSLAEAQGAVMRLEDDLARSNQEKANMCEQLSAYDDLSEIQDASTKLQLKSQAEDAKNKVQEVKQAAAKELMAVSEKLKDEKEAAEQAKCASAECLAGLIEEGAANERRFCKVLEDMQNIASKEFERLSDMLKRADASASAKAEVEVWYGTMVRRNAENTLKILCSVCRNAENAENIYFQMIAGMAHLLPYCKAEDTRTDVHFALCKARDESGEDVATVAAHLLQTHYRPAIDFVTPPSDED